MIKVTSTSIYIDDGSYSFEDVYSSVQESAYAYKAKKSGDKTFFFDFDFYIGKDTPAILIDKNKNIEINGSLFQIYEGSEFQFGELNNSEPMVGGSFIINNPELAYGFGNQTKNSNGETLSGNLKLYGSYIEIPCFWGFFNSPEKQKVEIKNCIIKGFGRISGKDSYVENVTYLNPETKYGSISTKGQIKYIKNVNIVNADSDAYALYFNPSLSGNATLNSISIKNCNNTIYCEKADTSTTLTLVDLATDSLSVYFKDSNVNIEIKHTVKFLTTKENVNVKIYRNGEMIDELIVDKAASLPLTEKIINNINTSFLNEYEIVINNLHKIPLKLKEKVTIDIDMFEFPVVENENQEIYLLPKKEYELEDVLEFFVSSFYPIDSIELCKSNFNKIASPVQITQISENLYRVVFFIGELGTEGENGEKWQDGPYLIKTNIKSKQYLCPIYIARPQEEEFEEVVEEVIQEEKPTISNGAKIYL